MNIRSWHYGKIILLWMWAIMLEFLGLHLLELINHFIMGFIIIIMILIIPIIMSVITWKWFGSKEK